MVVIKQAFSKRYAETLAERINGVATIPSTMYDADAAGADGKSGVSPYRSSREVAGGLALDDGMDRLLSRRVAKMANALGVDEYTPERDFWNTIIYEPGQEFKLHTDCWDKVEGCGSNQRVLTALIVVQQAEEGGETVFPNLGLTMKPPAGYMVVWRNVLDGMCSPLALHAGMPVIKGRKIVLTKWYRGVDHD